MSGNRRSGGDRIAGSNVALPAAGPTRDLLDRAARLAMRRDECLAWVGGGVRDLLLGRPTVDLDLAIVGDPAAFASELAREAGGRVVEHPRFLTVTVELADGRTVDVARSRRESYPAPGALPRIEPAPLEADLARRDFSVNAIAVRLAPGPAELMDPLGAVADLAAGRLRTLHSGSFRDDPTRILRGIRFETRFGFAFDAGTESAASRLLGDGGLDSISGVRLRRELELTCESWPRLATTFERFAELGLLRGIDPDLTWSPEARATIEKAALFASEPALASNEPRRWLVGLLGLDPPTAARLRLLARLALGASEAEILRNSEARIAAALALLRPDAHPAPHRVAQVLERASAEELCRIAASGDVAAGWVRRDLDELRPLSLQVRGQDLVRAGIPAGPEIGAALRATLEARLDGRIGAAEELEFARSAWVREAEE